MTTAIVFPVNNKGGVGKTSVLTDLIAILSRTHTTGVIDFDLQASLAGTLLGDHAIGNRALDFYEELATREIELQTGKTFVLSDPMRRLRIEIQPTTTRLAVFPVGMLYHHPERRTKLEAIVNTDLASADIIGIDLPPIPDPALILDHSLKPILEIRADTQLFPMVVATLEHNTLQIGLKQFKNVYDYLLSLGIEAERISPILLINKVRTLIHNDIKTCFGIDHKDAEKLVSSGLMENEHDYPTETFQNEGFQYKVLWLPYFQHLEKFGADGKFSFYYGSEPQLFHFPELYTLATKEGYIKPGDFDIEENMFVQQLQKVAAILESGLVTGQRQYYDLRLERKNVAEVQSRLVRSMEEGERKAFEDWKAHPGLGNYETWQMEEVTARSWGDQFRHYALDFPGTAVPLGVMVQAISDTAAEIYPKMGGVVDEDYLIEITKRLTFDPNDKFWYGVCPLHNLTVKLHGQGDNSRWEIEVRLDKDNSPPYQEMDKKFPLDQTIEIFLRNLDSALTKLQEK